MAADQSTRRRGLQTKKKRREAVADLRVANQFQQPVRANQPRGVNQREDRRATYANRPAANRPVTRSINGKSGVHRGVGGGATAPRSLNVRLGGQMRRGPRESTTRHQAGQSAPEQVQQAPQPQPRRGLRTGQRGGYVGGFRPVGGINTFRPGYSAVEAERAQVQQAIAQRDPNYASQQGERRFGPHGLTFDQAERVRKQKWLEETWKREFERDNAEKRAQFDIDRRARETAEGRLDLDERRHELNERDKIYQAKKDKYEAMTAAEQKEYDREQAEIKRGDERLDAQVAAAEKDRRFDLDERKHELEKAQEARLAMQSMKPKEREKAVMVDDDNRGFFLSEAMNTGGVDIRSIYTDDDELTPEGEMYLDTLNVLSRANPDASTEELIRIAADRAGLESTEEVLRGNLDISISEGDVDKIAKDKAKLESYLGVSVDVPGAVTEEEEAKPGLLKQGYKDATRYPFVGPTVTAGRAIVGSLGGGDGDGGDAGKQRERVTRIADKLRKHRGELKDGDTRTGIGRSRNKIVDTLLGEAREMGVPEPKDEAAYKKLPVGSMYIAPDGTIKQKQRRRSAT